MTWGAFPVSNHLPNQVGPFCADCWEGVVAEGLRGLVGMALSCTRDSVCLWTLIFSDKATRLEMVNPFSAEAVGE